MRVKLPLLFSLCWLTLLGERCDGHPTSTSLLISESGETSGYKLIFFLFSEEEISADEVLSLLWWGANKLSISNFPLVGISPRLPCSEAEVSLGLRRPLCWEFSRASSTVFPADSDRFECLFPATGLCSPRSIRIISFLILSIMKIRRKSKSSKSGAPLSCGGANPHSALQLSLNNITPFYERDEKKSTECQSVQRMTAQNDPCILYPVQNVIHQKEVCRLVEKVRVQPLEWSFIVTGL